MSSLLLAALLAQGAVPTDTIGVAPPQRDPAAEIEPARRVRRFGVHLGLNATFTFDVALGRYFYGGATTQLTGLGAIADPERNYTVSLLLFGGVALPLYESRNLRLTADLTPALGFARSAPVNFLTVGFLAGLRLVHSSGFTVGLKLPLVGYAGSPTAQRGSLYYYYIQAIPTVPVITLGYSF